MIIWNLNLKDRKMKTIIVHTSTAVFLVFDHHFPKPRENVQARRGKNKMNDKLLNKNIEKSSRAILL